jgi:hypothetical protein
VTVARRGTGPCARGGHRRPREAFRPRPPPPWRRARPRHAMRRARRPGGSRASRVRRPSAARPAATGSDRRAKAPDERPAARRADLLRAEENADRDRQVERRTLLRQIRGCEVDGDPSRRIFEAGVADRAADSLARLLQGGIGQADDGEAGQPGRHVDFDADDAPLEPGDGGGEDRGEHAAHGTGARSTPDFAGRSPRYLPLIARFRPRSRRSPARVRQRTPAITRSVAGATLSTTRANSSSERPSSESAFVNMNGAPELRALIAPRYSFTTW